MNTFGSAIFKKCYVLRKYWIQFQPHRSVSLYFDFERQIFLLKCFSILPGKKNAPTFNKNIDLST